MERARGEEYVKRAGYVLMAALAVHDKIGARPAKFLRFLPGHPPRRHGQSQLRQESSELGFAADIGKRNRKLNLAAIRAARASCARSSSPSARWIAAGALRELQSEAVARRLARVGRVQ